jgi:hypothetical protein
MNPSIKKNESYEFKKLNLVDKIKLSCTAKYKF